MKIGIPLVGGIYWHGGVTYLEAIINAFRVLPAEEQPDLFLLIDNRHVEDLVTHRYIFNSLDGFIVIGNRKELPADMLPNVLTVKEFKEASAHVDCIFPVNSDCMPGLAFASWLPDFQHRHLPQLFSDTDFAARESAVNYVLAVADFIVVSSQAAKHDLVKFYPPYHGHVHVLHFHSRFDPEYFTQQPAATAAKYLLPERYIICCNQFWQHKNHDTLFKALALTEQPVPLVCTGAQEDYRNKDWFTHLKSLIADLGLERRIFFLGFIPRAEQIQLIRQSMALVQPSLFEGWSTVMEDARGLNKPVIASDLPIHREQALSRAHYFDPTSATELAALLDQCYAEYEPGPQPESEKEAQLEVARRQAEEARAILALFDKVITTRHTELASPALSKATFVQLEQTSRIERLKEELLEKDEEIQQKDAEIHSKHEALMKLTACLVEKEAVIHEINETNRAAIASQQSSSSYAWVGGNAKIRLQSIFAFRLGHLTQYAPQTLHLPARYARAAKLGRSPKIAIVTPSFKQGQYIERTLKSVLDQHYPNLEYFVQDGGSQDDTVAVLDKYSNRLTGWSSFPDNGQAHAINLGFAKTSGEIMAWLNSDDTLLPGSLNYVANYFERHPEVDVVYGHRLLIDENDRHIGRWLLPRHDGDVLSWADYIPQETMFWRRQIWEKAGGRVDESFRFAMDWDLLVRFREAGARFVRLPRFIGAFRIHTRQKTSTEISGLGIKEMNRIRERLLGRVPEDSEIYMAVLPYLRRHLATDLWWRICKLVGLQS